MRRVSVPAVHRRRVLSTLLLAVVCLCLACCTLGSSLSSASSWKPRSYPRRFRASAANAPAPQRHRFFLPNPCVLNDERTGAQFDLTPLKKVGSDYTATDGDYFYRMNVCGPVNAGGPCGNSLICQYTTKDQHFVAKIAVYDGYFGPRLTLLDGNNPGAGVQAHYLNGDICFLGPQHRRTPRTTIVQYKCGRESGDAFEIHEDKETCTFTATLHTPHACWPPGSLDSGISTGTTFLILVFLIATLYLGGGIMYNRKQGKEGMEAVPHLQFWQETLPGLVADGWAFTLVKVQEFREKRMQQQQEGGGGNGGLLGGGVDPDDPYKGQGAPTARQDDL